MRLPKPRLLHNFELSGDKFPQPESSLSSVPERPTTCELPRTSYLGKGFMHTRRSRQPGLRDRGHNVHIYTTGIALRCSAVGRPVIFIYSHRCI